MKKVIRLTESDLKQLVKKVLVEIDDNSQRMNNIVGTICNTKLGVIQSGAGKGKSFCDYYVKFYEVTEDELTVAQQIVNEKCPTALTTPEIPYGNKKIKGWQEIWNYFNSGKDGFKVTRGVSQFICDSDYYFFQGTHPNYEYITVSSNGNLNVKKVGAGRPISTTWTWENDKPKFNLASVTRGASGYAQTEEEITSGKKILGVGSRGDLVKRVQFESLYYTKGKTNPGCKKDTDGKFKPALCDGIYGPKTKNAVREFQKSEALKDKSGIVGAETWQSMEPFTIDFEGENFDS